MEYGTCTESAKCLYGTVWNLGLGYKPYDTVWNLGNKPPNQWIANATKKIKKNSESPTA